MYVRFTAQFINEIDKIEFGIFNAVAFVIANNLTENDDVEKLKKLNKWFSNYLKKPDRFSNAQNKNPKSVSLSWFKDSSKTDIMKMHEIKDILAKYDLTVEMIATKTPGYIIYEDEHQVSAIPFRSDLKKVL